MTRSRRVDVRTDGSRVNTVVNDSDDPEGGPVVVVAWDARRNGAEEVMAAVEDARKEIGHQLNAVDPLFRRHRALTRADGGEEGADE